MKLLRSNDTSGTEAEQPAGEPISVGDTAADNTTVRPTFTPANGVPTFTPANDAADDDDADADEPAVEYTDAADEPPESDEEAPVTTDTPVITDAEPVTVAPVASTATATAVPAMAPSLDQPLLSGDAEVLTRWQRVQAEFVDDPQVAVAGAADLVEQAGQALVDALEQRQRQMRAQWDQSAADGSGTPDGGPADGTSDTEQLRLMMQRYRALFNQLYQPA